MDSMLQNATKSLRERADKPQDQQSSSDSGGLMDKLQGLAGGGTKGEQREDALDKGKFSIFPFTLLFKQGKAD